MIKDRITKAHADHRTYTLADDLTCFACNQQHTQTIEDGSIHVKQSSKTKAYYRLQTVCLSDVCNGDRFDYVWYGNVAETDITITEKLVVPF